MKNIAIIVAGGRGKRMGRPKQFLKIGGRPMLEWTIEQFQKTKMIDGIILVVAAEDLKRSRKLKFSKIIAVTAGGEKRQDSVQNGLDQLPAEAEIVVIHDGARPAVTGEMIVASIRTAQKFGAALTAVPVKDTIKKVKRLRLGKKFEVEGTIDRAVLWAAQTPQTFQVSIIHDAYARMKGEFTDDAALVERMKKPVVIVFGSYANIKVTTPEDLMIMEKILTGR